jgi:hypothetical protein
MQVGLMGSGQSSPILTDAEASGEVSLPLKNTLTNIANIYRNAKSVLVMIGGCRVAQGLDQHASWIDRAWTLQEAILCKDTFGLFAWNDILPPRGTVGWLPDHNNARIERVRSIDPSDPEWWASDDVGIMRLRQLLSITPDVNMGTLSMGTDVDNPESSHELQWSVKCLGEYRFPISILETMIEGLHNPIPETKTS